MEDRMHRGIILIGLIVAPMLFAACAGSRLTTTAASQKLKPIAPLPEREQLAIPVNLFIRIQNVADAGTSYRNYVKLFINGKEIAPDEPENNLQTTYTYSLRLQPGIYEVKAEYHVVGFWKEYVYDITTDEPVKVLPGKRTELEIRLDKDSRGFPRTRKNQFTIRYRPVSGVMQPEPSEYTRSSVIPDIAHKEATPLPAPEKAPAAPLPEPPAYSSERPGSVELQINTVPLGADVYVDDLFVGQSPVKIRVSASERHVIQVSKKGYREFLKVITPAQFRSRKNFSVIIRLEKE